MTERRALILFFTVSSLLFGGLFRGLQALSANDSVLFLGFIVPLIVCAHLSSRIVMHYDEQD
jgi:hypothetical protein